MPSLRSVRASATMRSTIAEEDDDRALLARDIGEFVDPAVGRRQPEIGRGRAERDWQGCCGHDGFSFAIVAPMKRSAIRDGFPPITRRCAENCTFEDVLGSAPRRLSASTPLKGEL